jgi:riboflavin synthase alpha subunit
MFTGLVEERGRVSAVEPTAGGRRFWIAAARVLEDARVGDSLAVSGCCLTVLELDRGRFAAEAVPETLRRTTLGELEPGADVNLERPLRLDQRLSGHLVQGHVDGVGLVRGVVPEGAGRRVTLELPEDLARFVAEKGSLAVDGVSLTVAACAGRSCDIAYIPHTLEVTTAGSYTPGRRVNLEVDLLARYLARWLEDAGPPGRKA